MTAADPAAWALALAADDIPARARHAAALCLLDTLGVAAAATRTPLARMMARFVRAQMPGDTPLLFTEGGASTVGATLYGAALTDALDGHDGHVLTKGHVGAAVIPALLALPGVARLPAGALLTDVVIGYEIGTRAGIALHATAPDYHSSGAWNGLAVAAVAGRRLGLDAAAIREALGTAEFYGPRSQMLRCIDHPTMVKDGTAWGALAGVSAALLARDGFTGAPAVTVFGEEVAHYWTDLGHQWRICEQYRKPYPVCRWAQPAVEAIRALHRQRPLPPELVHRIEVITFHEARRLAVRHPATTEQAQYSLPWSVACAVLGDGVDAGDVAAPALAEPRRRRLAERVTITESAAFNDRFPAQRWAIVRVHLTDGTVAESPPCQAHGDAEQPLSPDELRRKFFGLTEPVLGRDHAERLYDSVLALERGADPKALQRLTQQPPAARKKAPPARFAP